MLKAKYPVAPRNVDPKILQPSAGFRSEVVKVLSALFFFLFVYLMLVASGFALAALCAAGGISLILLKPMIITIGIGIGLAGLGVMVVFFLIKFVFKKHKVDRSNLIEITEADQPRLFEFIRSLTKETDTQFPKRIYVSHDVNASVFYDSGFWSMFLPVKKNLLIGLGLVNSVNISEFKAVLAHEFGHFSQRSMKLGSVVYNMNNIILNMLFENDGYERTLEKWGNASGYFAFFALLTFRIVQGIQWILQQVYTVVNRQYMGLSRQMEFHADTVAASVSGGNHLITSLRRLEVADTTYTNVFSFYEQHFKDALRPDNVYPQHREVMKEFARFHELALQNELPVVNHDSFAYFNRSRITIRNQWDSHPSTDDREKHLRSLNLETPIQTDSAWSIFDNAEALQESVTEKLFSEVKYEKTAILVDRQEFAERFTKQRSEYELNSIYKGFFDSRNISNTPLKDLEERIVADANSITELLNDEVLSLPHRINGAQQDLQTLAEIRSGNARIKHFLCDGIRHKAKDAGLLYIKLEKELKDYEAQLAEADKNIIAWFIRRSKEKGRGEELREQYSEYFATIETCDADMKIYMSMHECLVPLYQTMPLPQIQVAVGKLKEAENNFRKRIAVIINDPAHTSLIRLDQHQRATEYLGTDWQYFNQTVYNQPALELLNEVLYLLYSITTEKAFRARQDILESQLTTAGLRGQSVMERSLVNKQA